MAETRGVANHPDPGQHPVIKGDAPVPHVVVEVPELALLEVLLDGVALRLLLKLREGRAITAIRLGSESSLHLTGS